MSTELILLQKKDNIITVLLNRPERLNAFNADMFMELQKVTETIRSNLPRAVIITGKNKKSFCAGFDVNPDNPQIAGLMEAVQQHDEKPVKAVLQKMRAIVDAFVALPVPVIAALNGLAYGGGAELATRCDLRIMDPEAVISFSEIKLGLMPDWGGGASLVKLIGSARAADLILTGRKLRADEALSLGLINKISAQNQSLEEAVELAGTIAENGPRAVRHALHVIRQGRNLSLDETLDLELEQAAALIASGECIHGITAFLSRKKPDFPDP
jgi:enoyl-CoA hydratase/carnithine racemase